MAGPAPETPSRVATSPWHCGSQERAVLAVLVEHRNRVVSRRELSRLAGLTELSERRCDSVLVAIRRELGASSVITVRSRGWRLSDEAAGAAEVLLAPDA